MPAAAPAEFDSTFVFLLPTNDFWLTWLDGTRHGFLVRHRLDAMHHDFVGIGEQLGAFGQRNLSRSHFPIEMQSGNVQFQLLRDPQGRASNP